MSIITHTHDHVSPLHGVMDTARMALRTVIEWHRKRKAEAELQELDDRMLADIGITRGEIHEKVWG